MEEELLEQAGCAGFDLCPIFGNQESCRNIMCLRPSETFIHPHNVEGCRENVGNQCPRMPDRDGKVSLNGLSGFWIQDMANARLTCPKVPLRSATGCQ